MSGALGDVAVGGSETRPYGAVRVCRGDRVLGDVAVGGSQTRPYGAAPVCRGDRVLGDVAVGGSETRPYGAARVCRGDRVLGDVRWAGQRPALTAPRVSVAGTACWGMCGGRVRDPPLRRRACLSRGPRVGGCAVGGSETRPYGAARVCRGDRVLGDVRWAGQRPALTAPRVSVAGTACWGMCGGRVRDPPLRCLRTGDGASDSAHGAPGQFMIAPQHPSCGSVLALTKH
jgi:hypothetical protein